VSVGTQAWKEGGRGGEGGVSDECIVLEALAVKSYRLKEGGREGHYIPSSPPSKAFFL